MEGGEYIQRKKKKEKNNNRRFSDEQIKCLESIFEVETKLEPRKKVQLARELGLQPRQVAIWFQNRRARWKAKQIEQEYRVLKADFDNLNSRYELVNKEKQSLLIQLQKLSDLLKKPQNEGRGNKDLEGISTDSGSDNGERDFKAKPSCLCDDLGNGVVMYSDDDERENIGYPPKKEETKLLNLGEQIDGSLVPQEKWCNFDSGGLFDHTHTCGTSNWWDFWT